MVVDIQGVGVTCIDPEIATSDDNTLLFCAHKLVGHHANLGIELANWKEGKKSQMVAMVCEFAEGELEKRESNEQWVRMLQDLIRHGKDMGQEKPEDDKAEKDVQIIKTETQKSENARTNVKKEHEHPKVKAITDTPS